MRRVEVEARDDSGHLEGGHAVIVVQGIDHLDDGVTFFLRPLDAVALEDGLGALEHEQRAIAVRGVPGGVELVVGPDVTEHPALQPGGSVEIEIPDSGVWSEFQWPEVTARARPRRAKIVANRPPSDGHTSGQAAGQVTERARPTTHLSAATPDSRTPEAPPQAQAARNAHPVQPNSADSVQKETTSMANSRTTDHVADPAAEGAVHEQRHAEGQEYVVFYPYARGGKLGAASGPATTRRTATLLPTTRMGAAATAVAALLAVQGLLWFGSGGTIGVPPSPAATSTSAGDDISIFDLFAVGPVSPRGVQARDFTSIKALENAQASLLTPGAPRDAEEASYWLRRFITSSGSDERTRRVLTQLGTTFADTTNHQAEYGKARQVWELASAFGDPVAMCFLGTLHENGLGVAPDRKIALQWYERAKQTGGCPSVDDSIARVKK